MAAASSVAAASTQVAPSTPLAIHDVSVMSPPDSREQQRSRQRKMHVPDLQKIASLQTLGNMDNAVQAIHGAINSTIDWVRANGDNSKVEWGIQNQITRTKFDVTGDIKTLGDDMQQRISRVESEVTRVISELATLRRVPESTWRSIRYTHDN